MYFPKIFLNQTDEKIAKDIKSEGFEPKCITDEPGYIYTPHSHLETKLLVFLKGTMDVTVNGETYHCKPGDKLIIPGGITHSGIIGKAGCTYFWSEKLLE